MMDAGARTSDSGKSEGDRSIRQNGQTYLGSEVSTQKGNRTNSVKTICPVKYIPLIGW